MNLRLSKNVKNSKDDFAGFNNLSVKVFGLSLEKWYNAGYWGDKYDSYTYFNGVKAVANISVSKIYTLVKGEPRLYIQLGNVSTDPEYRHQGFIRRLMQEVMDDYVDICDGIYLYANETVIDFYPKFGFEKADEYQYSKEIVPHPIALKKLDMENDTDIKLLEYYYNKNNPFSANPMLKNFDLLMFYCGNSLKNNIYYSEKLQAVIIASFHNDTMLCYDIYCDEENDIDVVLNAGAREGIKTVALGFTPKNIEGYTVKKIESNVQLFVHKKGENMFTQSKMMLPLLSHA